MPSGVTGGQRPPASRPIGCASVAGMIIAAVALFIWAVQVAMLTDLSDSDAAGNGMAQGFAAVAIIVLWVLLAGLTIFAAIAGDAPMWAAAPALVALPLSGFAAATALNLLAEPNTPPFLWPIVVSAMVPPLIVTFCLWALIPSARAAIPAWPAATFIWVTVLIVSASITPMAQIRAHVLDRQAAVRAKWDADYARLKRDAPLWDWLPLLQTANGNGESAMIDGIRHLARRQEDAELMLARGDFPLRYLGRIDLTPNQTICDTARALLRKNAESLALKAGESEPYATIRFEVAGAVAAMDWLVGYDCPSDTESLAWETMAVAYSDPEFDVVRLRELRDPKVLGQTLREHPAHFSMLSPRSHLMAWLHYAGDKTLREQALAGARALDHRTDDAVDMLNGTEYVAWEMLIYLPDLDLEATPELCEAARREVHRELNQIYRPRNDDPRPYRELLDRMGTGQPLRALVWLTENGCETDTEVREAEALVGAYQNSPDRAAMLMTLAALRRKP